MVENRILTPGHGLALSVSSGIMTGSPESERSAIWLGVGDFSRRSGAHLSLGRERDKGIRNSVVYREDVVIIQSMSAEGGGRCTS